MAKHSDSSPAGAPAIITFVLLAQFFIVTLGVFWLAMSGSKVEAVVVGLVSAVVTALTNALSAITGFWLANSLNANRSGAAKDAVIGQLSGVQQPQETVV